MDHLRYITRDPQVCGGDYIIRGTRITLRVVLANLATGIEYADMHRSYPAITPQIFRGIIAFAAAAAQGAQPTIPRATTSYCTNCVPFDYLAHFDKPDPRSEVFIRGTAITISSLLAHLAQGDREDSILDKHPELTHEQLRAVVAFAAASAQDDMPLAGLPPEFGGAMAILARIDELSRSAPAAE